MKPLTPSTWKPGKAILFATALALLLIVPTFARADDAPKKDDAGKDDIKKEEPKKWETVATVGVTLSHGNSKNFLATGSLATKRSWSADELLMNATAGYGENTTKDALGRSVDNTTDNYIRAAAQWNHLFTERIYAGVRITGEHDEIAGITYRFTATPLAGYYFVKQTNAFLSAEVGPGYVREKLFSDDVHNYLAIRFGERGEYKFKSGARIWENVEWFPKVQDFNDYFVNAEAGVSAPISKGFSVSLVMQDSYRSVPAKGKLHNDFKLIAGLSYTF
jgi:hypothetical protein